MVEPAIEPVDDALPTRPSTGRRGMELVEMTTSVTASDAAVLESILKARAVRGEQS
jgi:hypothetical protein